MRTNLNTDTDGMYVISILDDLMSEFDLGLDYLPMSEIETNEDHSSRLYHFRFETRLGSLEKKFFG